jgi:hypothetical protein
MAGGGWRPAAPAAAPPAPPAAPPDFLAPRFLMRLPMPALTTLLCDAELAHGVLTDAQALDAAQAEAYWAAVRARPPPLWLGSHNPSTALVPAALLPVSLAAAAAGSGALAFDAAGLAQRVAFAYAAAPPSAPAQL